jgi:RNA polymerase sigma-70 factor (ECF subfamily)
MDRTDFHQLYEAHARDVYRFAMYLTRSKQEAEDVTAEVFLRAWAGVDAIRHVTARAYLIAIARNIARDRMRKARRETGIDREFESSGATGEQRLDFERTLEALQALPEELREPLTMSAVGGMTYEDVARELGLSLPTVKIRIFRARQKLAAQMAMSGKATKEVSG